VPLHGADQHRRKVHNDHPSLNTELSDVVIVYRLEI
jgi:hypothetical protein